jgi:hypothetical protein
VEGPVLHVSSLKHPGNETDEALIVDPLAQEVEQDAVIDVVERTLDTLPTTITSTAIPSTSRLFDHAIRWRGARYRSWAGVIGKISCICCWCCPMAVAH